MAIYILYEAYLRLKSPPQIESTGMFVVAVLGLIINLISMRMLSSGQSSSLNVKGAYLEVWSDLLGSVGVIAGAIIIRFTGWAWVDSAIAVLIGLWVLPRTWILLKSSLNVLLEGVPDDVDLAEVEKQILATPGVKSFHDLHIWALTSGKASLTVHVVNDTAVNPEMEVLPELKQMLADKFDITHVTIQFELAPCEQADAAQHFNASPALVGSKETKVRVLVVEDEPRTAEYLQKGLSESGFVVDIANNGGDGLHMAEETDYDVIILDVMLPGMDGWTVIKSIRSKSETPVLFLTALDDVADRVRGFELGADDYLVKPFAFAELLARIRRCLRQSTSKESERLRIADLDIDVLGRRVFRGTTRIELTNQEFSLLHLLMRRRGEVLSRTTIASQVWDVNFDTDTNVVDVAIRRLRSKVDDPFDQKLIHTVRGMGYVLDPERGR